MEIKEYKPNSHKSKLEAKQAEEKREKIDEEENKFIHTQDKYKEKLNLLELQKKYKTGEIKEERAESMIWIRFSDHNEKGNQNKEE